MSGKVLVLIATGLCLLTAAACLRRRPSPPAHAAATAGAPPAPAARPASSPLPAAPPTPPLTPPPDEVAQALLELAADDLQLLAADYVNPSVVRLSLARSGRRWRAKWKAMGPGGSEVQEGIDGNNSPRCEVAAFLLARELAGPAGAAQVLVPPVVVRALHRDVPCERGCRGLPRLLSAATPATFPELNDHLVFGALSLWIEGARTPRRLHGELWSRERFAVHRGYRRSVSDLFLFLYVIAHGDANYGPNFLLRLPDLGRVYSIDNGRAFDGLPYYVGEGDADWQPLARLAPDRLVAPRFAAEAVAALARLTPQRLHELLALVAAVELATGRTVGASGRDAALSALAGRSLEEVPSLRRRSRQTYTGAVSAGGPTLLLLGIGPAGIQQTAARAAQAAAYLRRADGALFSD